MSLLLPGLLCTPLAIVRRTAVDVCASLSLCTSNCSKPPCCSLGTSFVVPGCRIAHTMSLLDKGADACPNVCFCTPLCSTKGPNIFHTGDGLASHHTPHMRCQEGREELHLESRGWSRGLISEVCRHACDVPVSSTTFPSIVYCTRMSWNLHLPGPGPPTDRIPHTWC